MSIWGCCFFGLEVGLGVCGVKGGGGGVGGEERGFRVGKELKARRG